LHFPQRENSKSSRIKMIQGLKIGNKIFRVNNHKNKIILK
jgi:hypothetical protein